MRLHQGVLGVVALGTVLAAQQAPNPRQQPDGAVHIHAPEQPVSGFVHFFGMEITWK